MYLGTVSIQIIIKSPIFISFSKCLVKRVGLKCFILHKFKYSFEFKYVIYHGSAESNFTGEHFKSFSERPRLINGSTYLNFFY